MIEYKNVLQKSKLFLGFQEQQIESILGCLDAKIKRYKKDAVVFFDGGSSEFFGVVLEGEVQAQKIDYNGGLTVVSSFYPCDIIAASACCSTKKQMPFDVVCVSDVSIAAFDVTKILTVCKNACSFHSRLVQNLLTVIADKNIFLAQKIELLSKPTTKEKVLSYLYGYCKKPNQKFTVPASRRQMAQYLSVNRSALSRQLSALRNEGILDFMGNTFVLKK